MIFCCDMLFGPLKSIIVLEEETTVGIPLNGSLLAIQ